MLRRDVLPFSAGYRNPKTISVGPWGGKGGNSWYDTGYGIRQIIVVYGDAIDSINIEYDERNGASVWSKHEGRGGIESRQIELDYPNEKITSISGHYDTYVRSLTFESNVKKIYGPYGVEDGTYFSFSMAEGEIVGFHGRSGSYLDCIGVYISNLQALAISKSLKPISVGPWGGKGGDVWDDEVRSGIHQIIVVYGDAIGSINIEYDNNGSPFPVKHGGSTGNKIGKIQLDYPREILTSISGYYDTYLRSLTFKSNLKKYGPYGRQQGTYFSFPISDGKIVGFHGRSGLYLDCIGVYLSNLHTAVPPQSNTVISIEPWGGRYQWDDVDQWDDGACAGVRQIILDHGRNIDSIQIEYERDGSSVWSRHGGRRGKKTDMIILDYPRESLISISGHYQPYLRSLSFESNLRKYGPYGVERGTYFSLPTTTGRIVGFHGKSGKSNGSELWYLHSIGVYISNLHYSIPSIPSQSNTVISIGPWGGKCGDKWDDGACAGVRQIILVHSNTAIDSIQIEYERDGSSVWSRHGGRRKNNTDTIILAYPTESLISISGHYDNYLRSLSFDSNLQKYGPYGVEQGTYFSFPMSEGRIVGFHGKSGRYLDSIGVYISNFHYSIPSIPSQIISAGPWGGNGGHGWDDGEYRGIRRITLVHGDFIYSINIEYEKDGRSVWSKHGGGGDGDKMKKIDEIWLDYSKGEVLTSISGHYYNTCVTVLTFVSNYKRCGRYGVESGTWKRHGPYGTGRASKRPKYFSVPTEGEIEREIVSFYGRSGDYLDCIGVYLSNLPAPNPPKVSQSEEIEDGNENNDTVGSIQDNDGGGFTKDYSPNTSVDA